MAHAVNAHLMLINVDSYYNMRFTLQYSFLFAHKLINVLLKNHFKYKYTLSSSIYHFIFLLRKLTYQHCGLIVIDFVNMQFNAPEKQVFLTTLCRRHVDFSRHWS
jgi:hypothetical protein